MFLTHKTLSHFAFIYCFFSFVQTAEEEQGELLRTTRINFVRTIQALKNSSLLLEKVVEKLSEERIYPKNCAELHSLGDRVSGIRRVYPFGDPYSFILVWCDQETDGGGWTTIQRRVNLQPRENFVRSWIEYVIGFGYLPGEFWLGLRNIHSLVNTQLMSLRMDLEDYLGEKRWAKYQTFYVDSEATNYTVSTTQYSGDAGDVFNHPNAGHSGLMFSTYDRDNDNSSFHCAEKFKGGWWYNKCHIININGFPYQGPDAPYAEGITNLLWHGHNYSLKKTVMLIRPSFNQGSKSPPRPMASKDQLYSL
ncbi:UNVERIFIED_CONTAM: hypothetical protein GTU68_058678 [Idotea baltica]|nr:hypothetical protein [Idotea baltica]